jgi:hypothetical protein
MDAALADLRLADAKHRLAYILTRAAVLDCERGRVDSAVERATEALEYATLLERATEMLIANAVLSHASSKRGDGKMAKLHASEVTRLADEGAAVWTNEIVAALQPKDSKKTGRKRK